MARQFGWPKATGPPQQQKLLVLIVALLMMLSASDALQCYQCGQYNDGVGSITPCLIYTEPLGREHLKSCPRTAKYCIKYVSELSVVRDCVADCKEKEVWETRTLCCNEDGCNGATHSATIPVGLIAITSAISIVLLHSRFHLSLGA